MSEYRVRSFSVYLTLDEEDYRRLSHQAARHGYSPQQLIDVYIELGTQEHEQMEAEEDD